MHKRNPIAFDLLTSGSYRKKVVKNKKKNASKNACRKGGY